MKSIKHTGTENFKTETTFFPVTAGENRDGARGDAVEAGAIETATKIQIKEDVMKIAVSSDGKDLQSPVNPRFGRAPYFVIYDTADDNYEVIDNAQNLQAAQGAGIQAAQHVVNKKADVVISGNLGPKAFTTLQAAGIKAACWADGTVEKAINLAKEGKLKFVDSPNVEGHWV